MITEICMASQQLSSSRRMTLEGVAGYLTFGFISMVAAAIAANALWVSGYEWLDRVWYGRYPLHVELLRNAHGRDTTPVGFGLLAVSIVALYPLYRIDQLRAIRRFIKRLGQLTLLSIVLLALVDRPVIDALLKTLIPSGEHHQDLDNRSENVPRFQEILRRATECLVTKSAPSATLLEELAACRSHNPMLAEWMLLPLYKTVLELGDQGLLPPDEMKTWMQLGLNSMSPRLVQLTAGYLGPPERRPHIPLKELPLEYYDFHGRVENSEIRDRIGKEIQRAMQDPNSKYRERAKQLAMRYGIPDVGLQ